ncbi:MAG: hypothetical protein ACI8PZ_001596 [Myxococcota bacterium]|jgi:hypothetical protein
MRADLLALLALAACAPHAEPWSVGLQLDHPEVLAEAPQSEPAPPPDFLDLAAPASITEGARLSLEVSGADPGDRITFIYTTRGYAVTCPALLGGECVDLRDPRVLATVPADADGVARYSVVVPLGTAGATVFLQAVYVDGPASIISDPESVDVLPGDADFLTPSKLQVDAYWGVNTEGEVVPVRSGGLLYPSAVAIRMATDIWSGDFDDTGNYCTLRYNIDASPRSPWAPGMWYGIDAVFGSRSSDCALDPVEWPDPLEFFDDIPFRLAIGPESEVTITWLEEVTGPARPYYSGGKMDTDWLGGDRHDYVYSFAYPVDPATMEVPDGAGPVLGADIPAPDGIAPGWYFLTDAQFIELD